jgi:hypothetical protein
VIWKQKDDGIEKRLRWVMIPHSFIPTWFMSNFLKG